MGMVLRRTGLFREVNLAGGGTEAGRLMEGGALHLRRHSMHEWYAASTCQAAHHLVVLVLHVCLRVPDVVTRTCTVAMSCGCRHDHSAPHHHHGSSRQLRILTTITDPHDSDGVSNDMSTLVRGPQGKSIVRGACCCCCTEREGVSRGCGGTGRTVKA